MIYNMDSENIDIFSGSTKWTEYDEIQANKMKEISLKEKEDRKLFITECVPFLENLGWIITNRFEYVNIWNLKFNDIYFEDIAISFDNKRTVEGFKQSVKEFMDNYNNRDNAWLETVPKIKVVNSETYLLHVPCFRGVYVMLENKFKFSLLKSRKYEQFNLKYELEHLLKCDKLKVQYDYLNKNKKCFWQLDMKTKKRVLKKHNKQDIVDEVNFILSI